MPPVITFAVAHPTFTKSNITFQVKEHRGQLRFLCVKSVSMPEFIGKLSIMEMRLALLKAATTLFDQEVEYLKIRQDQHANVLIKQQDGTLTDMDVKWFNGQDAQIVHDIEQIEAQRNLCISLSDQLIFAHSKSNLLWRCEWQNLGVQAVLQADHTSLELVADEKYTLEEKAQPALTGEAYYRITETTSQGELPYPMLPLAIPTPHNEDPVDDEISQWSSSSLPLDALEEPEDDEPFDLVEYDVELDADLRPVSCTTIVNPAPESDLEDYEPEVKVVPQVVTAGFRTPEYDEALTRAILENFLQYGATDTVESIDFLNEEDVSYRTASSFFKELDAIHPSGTKF